MRATDALRKAIVVLMGCTTEAKAEKCARRIDTIIDEIDAAMDHMEYLLSQVQWELVPEED